MTMTVMYVRAQLRVEDMEASKYKTAVGLGLWAKPKA